MSPDVIGTAAREVLETTAGAVVLGVSPGREPGDVMGLIATISLSGPGGGTLVIFCDRTLAIRLASSMLGLDGAQDPGDETLIDALGELANQVGGTLKRRLPQGGDMMLSVPVVAAASPVRHHVKSVATPICADVLIEGGQVTACLWPA
jgi:CheY-specific phosphatase CheX